ncbi:DUF2207 domain-containing protein [Murinocardiopsis flavida]|nr:DUF2207 domain-containing protein [Murinocardiopsis flavida]
MPLHVLSAPLRRTLRGACGAAALAVVAATALAGPASAQAAPSAQAAQAAPAAAEPGVERITSYDVDAEVRRDGSMRVTERISYDFADAPDRHGLLRLLLRERGGGTFQRESFEYRDIEVASPDAPDGVETEDDGHRLTLRIGDPGTEVSGRRDYVISYVVTGALARADSGAGTELDWDFIGDGWEVPIERVETTVRTPVPAAGLSCGTGSGGDCRADTDGRTATVVEGDTGEWSGAPLRLLLPEGAVDPAGVGTPSPYTPTAWGAAAAAALLLPLPFLPLLGRPRAPRDGTAAPSLEDLPPAVALMVDSRGARRPDQYRRLVAATLVDLHVRGFVLIKRSGSGWRIRPGEDATGEPSERAATFERPLVDHIVMRKDGNGQTLGALCRSWSIPQKTVAGARKEAERRGLLRGERSPLLGWITAAQVAAVLGTGACLLSMLGAQPWSVLDGTAYAFGAALLTSFAARPVAKRARLSAQGVLLRTRLRAHLKRLDGDSDTGVHDPGLRVAFGVDDGLNPDLAAFTSAARNMIRTGPPKRRGSGSVGGFIGFSGGGSGGGSSGGGFGGSSGGGGSW